jgi:hypothetical protein
MSPELDTLDQLTGSDMPLSVIRAIFADDARFVRAIQQMLAKGEVRLLSIEGLELPAWQWHYVLSDSEKVSDYRLSITERGGQRMA